MPYPFCWKELMSKILVHIHSGPDLKNKATLGMLVAVSAIKDGHDVSLFLAADGVHFWTAVKQERWLEKVQETWRNTWISFNRPIPPYGSQGCRRKPGDTMRICWKVSTLSLLCPIALLKLRWKQIRFFVIDSFWISLIFKMGYAIKRGIPRMGDPPRITLQVSSNLPLLP